MMEKFYLLISSDRTKYKHGRAKNYQVKLVS